MALDISKMNKLLLTVFTPQELEELHEGSYFTDSNGFMLRSKDYEFEIDIYDDEVDISYYSTNEQLKENGDISKEKLFELLKKSGGALGGSCIGVDVNF